MIDGTFSMDTLEVNYLTNEEGKKTGVVIPIEDWLAIKQLIKRTLLKEDLLQAFQEVQDMRNGVSPKLTLNDVINEL